jgi:hypothetical protein
MMQVGLGLVKDIISKSYKSFSRDRRAWSSSSTVMIAIFGQLIFLRRNQDLQEKFSLNVLLYITAKYNIFIKIPKIFNL